MSVVVGGVSLLYQGDYDVGRIAIQHLATESLGPEVWLEDLHYGAVAVAQRLQDLAPDSLVLVGAASRERAPGAVERRRVTPRSRPTAETQLAVADAVSGYVTVDLVVDVAGGLGALPARTVIVDIEPANTEPSENLSPEASAALEGALELVRAEVRRSPLLALAERIGASLDRRRLEPSPALDALEGLLGELARLDHEGRWGATFALRDRLRLRISEGETGYGMDHLDWGLWWALIEELDRLQPLEVSAEP